MPTALIIGAGPGLGRSCAELFTSAGFKIAVASRKQQLDVKFPYFPFDASKPNTMSGLFEKVSSSVGVPSVVVYNAYASGKDPERPLDREVGDFQTLMDVNTTSVYASAREAVKCFEKLGDSGLGPDGGTFIFTGNILNTIAHPGLMSFGIGKTASAHLIKHLALCSYLDKPYKFYYVDERLEDGVPMWGGISGDAHGKLYLELAKDPKQRPWEYTFAKDKGYIKFPHPDTIS